MWNHSEILGILIDAGADLNIQETDGETALYLCARWNHPEILGILIDAGADLNIQNVYGWTALHWCANRNYPEIAKMLIDAGADKTIPTNNGKLPYELADDTEELTELLKP
jgi:ankyrin repeat protein